MTCADSEFLAEQGPLSAAVDHGVAHGYQWAQNAMNASRGSSAPSASPPEQYLVAGLVLAGLPHMQMEWSRILGRYGLKVAMGGVFCHKVPIVKNSSWTVGCELGDLLLGHIHFSGGTVTSRSALLLQAKVAPAALFGSQLDLYTNWPDFEYTTGPHRGESRIVTPPWRNQGAQCLELSSPSSPHSPSARVAMASGTPKTYSSLGEEVARLPLDIGGRRFADKTTAFAEKPGDWSHVVWDLLEWAQSKINRPTFQWKGLPPHPRYGGDPIQYVIDSSARYAGREGLGALDGLSHASSPSVTAFLDPVDDTSVDRLWKSLDEGNGNGEDHQPPYNQPRDDGTGGGVSTLVIFTQGPRERPASG